MTISSNLYVDATDLIGGFAPIAWSAEYDAPGIQTFIVGHKGPNLKDLGVTNGVLARWMTHYNPDRSRRRFDLE